MNARKLILATAFALTVAQAASAQVTILTSRPGGDAIDWGNLEPGGCKGYAGVIGASEECRIKPGDIP